MDSRILLFPLGGIFGKSGPSPGHEAFIPLIDLFSYEWIWCRYFNVIGSDPKGRLGEAPRPELRKHGRISGACFDAAAGISPGLQVLPRHPAGGRLRSVGVTGVYESGEAVVNTSLFPFTHSERQHIVKLVRILFELRVGYFCTWDHTQTR